MTSIDPTIFQLISLKHGIKLMLAGIKPGRAWTKKSVLRTVNRLLSTEYTKLPDALAGLTDVLERQTAARSEQE